MKCLKAIYLNRVLLTKKVMTRHYNVFLTQDAYLSITKSLPTSWWPGLFALQKLKIHFSPVIKSVHTALLTRFEVNRQKPLKFQVGDLPVRPSAVGHSQEGKDSFWAEDMSCSRAWCLKTLTHLAETRTVFISFSLL